ncbi:hypothetical protein L209DRAFT_748534, partial [Thermothelomyces heterothallicus CBS 203.75]
MGVKCQDVLKSRQQLGKTRAFKYLLRRAKKSRLHTKRPCRSEHIANAPKAGRPRNVV